MQNNKIMRPGIQDTIKGMVERVRDVVTAEIVEDVDGKGDHLLETAEALEEAAGEGEGGEEEGGPDGGGLREGVKLEGDAAAEPGGLEGGVGVETVDGVQGGGQHVRLQGAHASQVGVHQQHVQVEEV